jgi:hypothetical protein
MPKFFEGLRQLPKKCLSIDADKITPDVMRGLINNENVDICLSVILPGLPKSSLGYLFIISKNHASYSLKNIDGTVFFRNLSLEKLCAVVKHASGVQYSDEIQKEFIRIRTEIGIEQ